MSERGTATVQTVYSGVDWISATLGRDEIDNQTWLYDCLQALEDIAMLGNVYKRRSLLGYDGWECAGCFVGSNDTAHYAQFAGKYADTAYHMIEHPKVHVSRIDIQITVQYDTELPKEGRYQYARAIHHNKGLLEHRRRKIHLYAGSDGSDTVYLGAPSSDVRGRIYNKAKQSGEDAYKRSWRYEIMFRDQYAGNVFRSVLSYGDAVTSGICQETLAWYRERGVIVLGVEFGGQNSVKVAKPARTDAARKLAWIKAQVVPTIRKLAEMGYAEELMEVIAEAIAAARNSQL